MPPSSAGCAPGPPRTNRAPSSSRRSSLRVISSRYNLLYVEIDTGFELYDLDGRVTGQADPYQLYNVYDKVPLALKVTLAKHLESLKLCRGNGGVGGGAPTPNSISCVLANVPEFSAGGIVPTASPAAAKPPPPGKLSAAASLKAASSAVGGAAVSIAVAFLAVATAGWSQLSS